MLKNKFNCYCFCILVFSCTMNDNTRTYKLVKANFPETITNKKTNKSQALSWNKPDTWVASDGSSMRLASFSIPYSKGLGDLSVIKLDGSGGGIEANINRWRRQLNLTPLSLIEIEKDIISKKGALGNYKMIEIINNESDNAFLCAIILLENSTIFIKLSLKIEGIAEIKNEFITFCSSLNFD